MRLTIDRGKYDLNHVLGSVDTIMLSKIQAIGLVNIIY
jgi:hypothetical protein